MKFKVKILIGDTKRDLKCMLCNYEEFEKYEIAQKARNTNDMPEYLDREGNLHLVTEKFVCDRCGYVHEFVNLHDCFGEPIGITVKKI